MKITADEFKVIAKYVYDISGISLEANKAYLVETRLSGLVEEHGCTSFSEFYYKAKSDTSKQIANAAIDAITTQETLWFRDTGPFELLKHKIIPDLIDVKTNSSRAGGIPLRIWSAACSTGQEAYSIAIVLKELLGDLSKYSIKIVGTDISDAALAAASQGKYNKFEIERGLPADKLQRYFVKEGDLWKIKDEIRAMATFRKLNLLSPLAGLGRFDIVFCRNVAIYFSAEDRKALFSKIANLLEPHGSLIIGCSEYLAGICPQFESQRHLRSVFYQLKSEMPRLPAKPTRTTQAPTPSAPSR